MKKKKWSRALAMLLMMVTAVSLLSGCGEKSAEKEDAETITVYLWSTNLYEKYAPYIQEQLPDINVEFVVGNNDLDFYKFLDENGGLPDIITCCRFSLHDASPLKDSLMDLSTTNVAGAVYDTYASRGSSRALYCRFTYRFYYSKRQNEPQEKGYRDSVP